MERCGPARSSLHRDGPADDPEAAKAEGARGALAHAWPGQCRKDHRRQKFNGEDIDSISPRLASTSSAGVRGFKLNIWDVGGQTSLRSYWRNYFEQTDGLIWVVDSADRARLQDCKAELNVLLQQERLAGASLLVFANKQDLEGALTAEEIRAELGLDQITTTKRHWRIEGCSAFTGAGLASGVDWLVQDISSRIWMYD